MMQMVSRTGRFITKDGEIIAIVQELHPSICVVEGVISGSNQPMPGSILIHNSDLRKRSKNASEWAVYPGIYSALRGMVSALRKGGAEPDVKDGELQELALYPDVLRSCSKMIFSKAASDERERLAFKTGIAFLLRALENRRGEQLTFAYLDTLRGSRIRDVRHRRNPGAAAMALGGAIHQVSLRDVDLHGIMRYLNLRVARIVEQIETILGAYESLLRLLGGRNMRKFPEDAWIYRSSVKGLSSSETIRFANREINNLVGSFAEIRVLPYLRHAPGVQAFLAFAHDNLSVLSRGWNQHCAEQLQKKILQFRQEILWKFALHQLEVGCHAPLSWMQKDDERRMRIVRMAVNGSRHDGVYVSSDQQDQRAQRLLNEMYVYKRKLRKCPDHLLQHQIGASVREYVNEAIGFAEQGDWSEAKRLVECATSFM